MDVLDTGRLSVEARPAELQDVQSRGPSLPPRL